jgi:CDP-glucose 4,6-dehydratase
MSEFWRDLSVLVTGDTGFKGAWLSLWLTSLGARVMGFALPPEGAENLYERALIHDLIAHTNGDLRVPAQVTEIIERAAPDVVFHLAAQSLVRRSYVEPVETYDTNLMGTVHILDALRRHQQSKRGHVKAIIIATSDKCYENSEDFIWGYRELDRLGGHDPYSSSKAAAEIAAAAYRDSYGVELLPIATVRAGNVIGGGDWSTDRLIPDTIKAFREGREVLIRNPQSIRPWQHVLEPLRGYLQLAEKLSSNQKSFADAWNFGPGLANEATVADIVDEIVRLWGNGALWRTADQSSYEPYEATVLRLDASKATIRLGWRPFLSLARALQLTVEWYRADTAADPRSMQELTRSQIQAYAKLVNSQASP